MTKNDLLTSKSFIDIDALVRATFRKFEQPLSELETRDRPHSTSKIMRLKGGTESLFNEIMADVNSGLTTIIPKKITANCNGHFKSADGEQISEFLIRELFYSLTTYLSRAVMHFSQGVADINDMFEHFCDVEALDFEYFMFNMRSMEYDRCPHCGTHVKLMFNPISMELQQIKGFFDSKDAALTRCSAPNGIGKHSITLAVPSGKLVVANDLRSLLTEAEQDARPDLSVNIPAGRKLNSDYHESLGMMYFQTSNHQIAVFKHIERSVITFKPEYYCENDEDIENFTDMENLVGVVSTGLWAVCAMDQSDVIRRCQESGLDYDETMKSLDAFVVNVMPGEYKATTLFETDFGSGKVFIEMSLVTAF